MLAPLLAVGGALGSGCSGCEGGAPLADAGPVGSATAAASVASAEVPEDDEVKPVYPALAGAPHPLAVRYCEAIHEVPAARKAECCKAKPGFRGTGECTRMLSHALADASLAIDPAAIDRCAAAMTRAHEGCDWVGATLPVPAECAGLLVGKLAAGARCRSSLECAEALHCHGLTPTRFGKCGPARPARGPCATGTDPLVSFVREPRVDVSHPQCQGYCNRRLCTDAVPRGGPCKVNAECGARAACVKGTCADEPPAEEPKKLGAPGAACASDAECTGRCDKGGKDAGSGTCVMGCDALPPIFRK